MLFDEGWRLDDASWNHPYQPFKDLSLEPSNSCFYRLFSEQPQKNEDLSEQTNDKKPWNRSQTESNRGDFIIRFAAFTLEFKELKALRRFGTSAKFLRISAFAAFALRECD